MWNVEQCVICFKGKFIKKSNELINMFCREIINLIIAPCMTRQQQEMFFPHTISYWNWLQQPSFESLDTIKCIKFTKIAYKWQWILSKPKPPWDQLLCSELTGVPFIQVNLTKTSCFGTLYKVRFIHTGICFYSGFILGMLHCCICFQIDTNDLLFFCDRQDVQL